MSIIGADSETSQEINRIFNDFVHKIGDSDSFSLIDSIRPLKSSRAFNKQLRKGISSACMPSFLPDDTIQPMSEVC